jgi:hypothetical protein
MRGAAALLLSAWASTLGSAAGFGMAGRVALPTAFQKAALSSHGARLGAGSRPALRMGFLDNVFKPKVSEDDPVWMQRDFKAPARAQGAWEEFIDDGSGEKYYYNTATQETLWEAEYL